MPLQGRAKLLPRNFWQSLWAVLLGNALYFGLVSHLPERARHVQNQIDWGLAVDAWFCLVFYGLLGLLKNRYKF